MMKKTKMVVKADYKMKLDEAGDYFNKVSRGTGVTASKKQKQKNFRKEKHKKRSVDLYWQNVFIYEYNYLL